MTIVSMNSPEESRLSVSEEILRSLNNDDIGPFCAAETTAYGTIKNKHIHKQTLLYCCRRFSAILAASAGATPPRSWFNKFREYYFHQSQLQFSESLATKRRRLDRTLARHTVMK